MIVQRLGSVYKGKNIKYHSLLPEMAGSVRFYTDILKLQVNFSNDWFVEFVLNDGARLSIANEERASIKSSGGRGITIALQVGDSKIAHESLLKAGADPTPIKQRWGANVFYVFDPEGNRIEFWS